MITFDTAEDLSNYVQFQTGQVQNGQDDQLYVPMSEFSEVRDQLTDSRNKVYDLQQKLNVLEHSERTETEDRLQATINSLQLEVEELNHKADAAHYRLDDASRVAQERKEELIRFFNAHQPQLVQLLVDDHPGNKINQIKSLRMMTGVGLKDAKEFVENVKQIPLTSGTF